MAEFVTLQIEELNVHINAYKIVLKGPAIIVNIFL